MGILYNKYIQFLRSSKKKRRQLACFVTALSVFVSGGVFWQLRGIGTAMVDENLPNADDSDEAITVTPLNASELETQDVWEATLPPLTDIAGENLARIAESQLGYSESSVNFVHAEDGETHNGYTRYGAWYGNPYGEWNTMFTYFCLNYAGVSSDDIPCASGCWAWSLELDKAGLIVPVTRGSPARGDILLIDSDLDGKADRSCIVQSVSDDEISAVEGDIDGSVALTSYLIGDEQLLGMVSLADIVPEPLILPDEPAEVDFSAESESGITVEAHADRGAFPPDTEMFVFDISQDEAVQAAADHFGDEAPDDIQAVAVDITFRSPDGEELEPAEDSQVRVSIVLPEEHSLTGGEFSLLHVSDDGDVQEVADASVSADGAEFVAESFSMYVVTASGINTVNSIVMEDGTTGTNSQTNPYVLYVGERLTVLYRGEYKDSGKITVFNNNDYITRYEFGSSNNDFNESTFRRAEFIGSAPGTCRVAMLKNGTWSESNIAESFWVKVVDPNTTSKSHHDIYLSTALGEKHIDNLHESLNGLHNYAHPNEDYYTIDEHGNRDYIKNGDAEVDGGDDAAFRPYRICDGDVFELITYCSPTEVNNLDFSISTRNGHQDGGNALQKIGDTIKTLVTSGEHTGKYRISAKFKGIYTANKQRSGVQIGDDFFYVVVTSNNTIMSHADIEIDDGGKYVFEEYSFDSSGNLTKKTTTYSAAVSDVNSCKIYNSNDEQLIFLKDDNYVAENKKNEGNPVEFVKDDYFKHGEPGSSQFELTSNYLPSSKMDESNGQNFGNIGGTDIYIRGNKNYSLNQADYVKFNVNLQLSHNNEVIEYYNNLGILTDTQSKAGNGTKSNVNNLPFSLGRQDIIDAYNKCPVHTGLDFTLAANAVMLSFQMKKEFVGGDISTHSFSFQLLDDNGDEVALATTDANGIIQFSNLYFNKAGTYEYTVREVTDPKSSDIIYTDDRTVTIVVEPDSTSKLVATIDTSNLANSLKNYQTYTLPATGGTGELPYILFGSAMLSGAFILLFIRRKKEAAH